MAAKAYKDEESFWNPLPGPTLLIYADNYSQLYMCRNLTLHFLIFLYKDIFFYFNDS